MPLQNRVTPFGEIIADPARGTVMGNRGNLHDSGDQILRLYQATRWIICKLDFNGRRRAQMPPHEWTSLFFLDEATALAAGHRPCYECNRAKARQFAEHWMAANPTRGKTEKAVNDLIDEQLHRDRITDAYYQRDRRKRVYLDSIDAVLAQERWIIDGWGPQDTIVARFTAADTIILVDHPLVIDSWWAIKRQVQCLFRPREDGPEGCPMLPMTWPLLRLIWTIHHQARPQLLTLIDTYRDGLQVSRLAIAKQ